MSPPSEFLLRIWRHPAQLPSSDMSEGRTPNPGPFGFLPWHTMNAAGFIHPWTIDENIYIWIWLVTRAMLELCYSSRQLQPRSALSYCYFPPHSSTWEVHEVCGKTSWSFIVSRTYELLFTKFNEALDDDFMKLLEGRDWWSSWSWCNHDLREVGEDFVK